MRMYSEHVHAYVTMIVAFREKALCSSLKQESKCTHKLALTLYNDNDEHKVELYDEKRSQCVEFLHVISSTISA